MLLINVIKYSQYMGGIPHQVQGTIVIILAAVEERAVPVMCLDRKPKSVFFFLNLGHLNIIIGSLYYVTVSVV